MKKNEEVVAEQLYKQLTQEQLQYLDRARDAALLTIPQMYPPEGSDYHTKYPTPYQSLGAKGVNNLANKIVLSLFPPSTAFFKLGLSPADMAALGKAEGEVKQAMGVLEQSIVNEMEVSSLRPKLVHLVKQLIIGGSCVIYVPDEGQPEIFKLSEFGIRRDKKGNVIRMAIRQEVAFPSLDEATQKQLPKDEITDDIRSGKKLIKMYTAVMKVGDDKYKVFQEIMKVKIEGTEGTFTKNNCPYIFVPFVDTGEDYGRSYVEDFIGDLQSYEGLRQSLLEGAAESARILYVLRPNATVSIKALRQAKSGDVISGNPEDISTVQNDKRLDMSVTQREAQELKQDLSITFLLDSAVRRDAERVTAAEIRQVSQELEVALGGIYSTLANTLQTPLTRLFMNRLVNQGKINKVLKDSLQLEITTGAAALGRGTDFNVLNTFVQTLGQIAQNPASAQYVNMPELISRLAYSLDINIAKLIVSEEERAMMAQAQQDQVVEQKVAPEVAKQALSEQE